MINIFQGIVLLVGNFLMFTATAEALNPEKTLCRTPCAAAGQ